jgi:hypothetical protein
VIGYEIIGEGLVSNHISSGQGGSPSEAGPGRLAGGETFIATRFTAIGNPSSAGTTLSPITSSHVLAVSATSTRTVTIGDVSEPHSKFFSFIAV